MRKAKVPDTAPVLILFGATASGKTALAEALFTGSRPLCRAEVISADSMQVYRGMDIGTAKPDKELQGKLVHHGIDIRNPNEQFNAGDFVRLADAACNDITARGALPVIVGGTGFYLNNFIAGLPSSPPSDPAVREQLRDELAYKGPLPLLEELSRLDPAAAQRIHHNDHYRILRALEVCRTTGRPLSECYAEHSLRPSRRLLLIGIRLPRETLYRRINQRCQDMFCRGLAGEVQALFRQGYTPADPGMRAIGYREFFVETGEAAAPWTLSGDTEGVKTLIARNSRRYAKRQETYFAVLPNVVWINGENHRHALDLLAPMIHTFQTTLEKDCLASC